VTKIGWRVFEECTSLTEITIPDGVTEIGFGAFWKCTSLTEITIPDSVTHMGEMLYLSRNDGYYTDTYLFWQCDNLIITYKGQQYTAEEFREVVRSMDCAEGRDDTIKFIIATYMLSDDDTPGDYDYIVEDFVDGKKRKMRFDDSGNLKYTENYNDAGVLDNIVECYDDGGFKYTQYHKNGVVSTEEIVRHDESTGDIKTESIRNYNEYGVLIKEIIYGEKETSFVYSEDNGFTYHEAVLFYDAYGNVTSITVTQTEEIGDQINTLQQKSWTAYTNDGNYIVSTTNTYNETTYYEYDDDTGVLKWVKYPGDTDATRTNYSYDGMYRLIGTSAASDQNTLQSPLGNIRRILPFGSAPPKRDTDPTATQTAVIRLDEVRGNPFLHNGHSIAKAER
jgi:hypothetical protein